MLYWLADLSSTLSIFNVFRYLTVRTAGSMITALVFVFMFGPWIIDHLRMRQGKGQPIRTDGPKSHILTKTGTPTMGGLMILLGIVVSTLLWANPRNPYVWIVLAVTLGFGLVGFYDDYLKVTRQTHSGFAGVVPARHRGRASRSPPASRSSSLGRPAFATSLVFPVFKDLVINLGWFFPVFAAFIIVGAGNAVNLTDGLDGLAIGPVMIASASFVGISYLVGNAVFSDYLQIHFVAGSGELAVVCGAVIGAGLGLSLVQRAAGLDLHGRHRFARARRPDRLGRGRDQARDRARHHRRAVRARSGVGDRAGGFVQAHRQARVPMAPIHHHFEQLGWTESQIVIRFWIIAIVLALAGLATLKLR